jgi:hypothetical protein
MRFLAALTLVGAAVTAGLVVLLNAIDAAPGIAVAVLGALSVGVGFVIGRNAERLPDLRSLSGHRGDPAVHASAGEGRH